MDNEYTELEFDFDPDEFRVIPIARDGCDGTCCGDCQVTACNGHIL